MRVARSAGGVLWRPGPAGREVVLVHRPRYDDWSLPKGKLSPGEHPLAAAVREVREETGVRGVPQVRLPSTRYLTGEPGVEKSVEYWAMRAAASGRLTAEDEVDEVRWLPVPAAGPLLTYAHDRGVLAAFAALRPVTGLVVLVRHAYAGLRGDWPGPDHERPLDATGRSEAESLAPLLSLFEPVRLVTASPVRCVQTLEPLAAAVSAPIEVDDRFFEASDPGEAADALRALGAVGATTVVCSQGKLIPPVMRLLTGRNAGRYGTRKAASWVLGFAGTGLVGAAHLPPPD